jgi:hypothetical protein
MGLREVISIDPRSRRTLLMKEVYIAADANPLAFVNPFTDLATRLNVDTQTLHGDLVYLMDKGYLKSGGSATVGFNVIITVFGIDYVEGSDLLTKDD